jgi:hypothetical protein
MLTQALADPRAWRADTIDSPSRWYYSLSERALTALEQALQEGRKSARPVTELRVSAALRAAVAPDLADVRATLETGRGFAVIPAGASGRYPPQELQAIYWLVGQLLGRPFEQNVQGTLLYDVRDTGQDVRYGARFSVTNSESTFHTDNSFGDEVLDYVGLLCINPAKAGGQSQLVSACTVERDLQARYPDAWEVLRQPFHIDRRGGVRPGEAPTTCTPIFSGDGLGFVVRYLRYWIEVGHEKAGLPLTQEQVQAMDILDRVAGEPSLRVEFMLKSGEMLFLNNRWLLHNRTGFEDYAELERRRHYVRLWLRRWN